MIHFLAYSLVGIKISAYSPTATKVMHAASVTAVVEDTKVKSEYKLISPIAPEKADELVPLIDTSISSVIVNPSSDGSGYDYGYCTWYVAYKRAADGHSIGSDWGNAAQWLGRATAAGVPSGTTPRVGAIVWFSPGNTLGHVAYVEQINADGSVLISEMNAIGWNVTSSRILSTGNYTFIY